MKKTTSKIQYLCEHTEKVDPKELIKHPKNINKHPSKQIKTLVKIIKKFGWRHSIIVSKRSGFIVCGEARQQAAIKMKCKAPVDYQDFKTEEDELAFLVADNWIPELAEIDPEKKKEIYEELKLAEYDMEIVGFKELKIENITKNPKETEVRDEYKKIDVKDYIKKFKNRIVLFSGGKDSMATVAWMFDNGFSNNEFSLIFNQTPLDFFGLNDFVVKFAKDNSLELRICKSKYCDPSEFIRQVETTGLPNYSAKWCTVTWKTQPLQQMLKDLDIRDSDDSVLIIGWRKEEGVKDGVEINKRATALDRVYSDYHKCHMARPILSMSEDQVYETVKNHNWKLFQAYKYMKRLGCVWCMGNTADEYKQLLANNPSEWSRAVSMIAMASNSDNASKDRLLSELRKVCGLSKN